VIARLARLASTHPRRVLLAAGAVFVLAAALGVPVTGMLGSSSTDFADPGSQYERTNAAIAAATGQSPYYNLAALVRSRAGQVTSPGARRSVLALARLIAAQHGFQRMLDYGGPGSDSRAAGALLSRDRRETVVLAAFATADEAVAAASRVRRTLARAPAAAGLAGVSVRFGGLALVNEELNELTTSELARAELIALPLLLALSFWFFRGLLAALLPPLVGSLAILLTFLGLRVIDHFTPVSVFALNLVSGMGLGLGIDYSLFVLYRYREERAQGRDAAEAIERTLQTVGRTVLYSCLTVAAAMTSLLVFPLRFLSSMGIGGALVTLCAGAVALLVLPSLLVVLGPRIDALSPAWLQRRAARSATATSEGGWWRLAHRVVRHPLPVAALAASVSAPVALGHGSFEITVLPHGSPFSGAQQRLLSRLRALTRPYGALVGGATAFFVDQRSSIAAHIPLALAILLALTAVFLFAMTGSVTIPIKALVMNVLSVGVGTGLVVLIFQDGHLSSLLGFTPIGGLEESTLVLMMVVAFALATDYEVFVLARIKEAHDQGVPNREAIALGVERTGRIVTAAALLFCVAIGALATSELFFTKQLGVGAALTVAIDASVIRALLVPSLMALMGDWNWWAPAPLRRLHARVGVREAV